MNEAAHSGDLADCDQAGTQVPPRCDGVFIAPQTEPPDNFVYDPAQPVPSLMSHHVLFGSGPRDIQIAAQKQAASC